MFKIVLTLVIALLMEGCASTKPVLYPNEHFKSVGSEAAERDIKSCMDLAESSGANSKGSDAGQAATSTAGGAAIGAASGAVGGAVVGSAGSGSAIGAASGATAGLLSWMFSKPKRSPVFENFVNQCLQDRGYQPIGWK
ncbi:YMGG-like glycine zipper-containing protein [Geomonas sp. RF6]|uniref:glycine zipper family protein n=1 Tax=Geomonas sp. RF6 TaxID=2897342 RepID=UPI001E392096|nr:glycine zipper family protein [Geomonas sp. RF6]UFS72050.1 YMGG-like glycine zipper-containing protein [Geomonas sp. RF6]